jgi:hypothetical protein
MGGVLDSARAHGLSHDLPAGQLGSGRSSGHSMRDCIGGAIGAAAMGVDRLRRPNTEQLGQLPTDVETLRSLPWRRLLRSCPVTRSTRRNCAARDKERQ